MRKIVLMFLLVSLAGFSQDVKDKIAEETCDCTSKFDISSIKGSELQTQFGLCILQSYNNHINEFPANEKLDFSNESQMTKFGEEIAMKMLKFCSNTIVELGKKTIDVTNYEEELENESVTGKIKSVSASNYFSIKLVENTGKTTDFILLNDFDNSFLITDKVLKINDNVQVFYYEIELYDIKLNKFILQKIISDIIKQ
jgi:hypothetical protein